MVVPYGMVCDDLDASADPHGISCDKLDAPLDPHVILCDELYVSMDTPCFPTRHIRTQPVPVASRTQHATTLHNPPVCLSTHRHPTQLVFQSNSFQFRTVQFNPNRLNPNQFNSIRSSSIPFNSIQLNPIEFWRLRIADF